MKFPIKWHEESLGNMKAYYLKRAEQFKREERELIEMEESIKFYEAQIDKAKQQKKDGFDSERFLKNTRPKGVR